MPIIVDPSDSAVALIQKLINDAFCADLTPYTLRDVSVTAIGSHQGLLHVRLQTTLTAEQMTLFLNALGTP